jgi:hypothetical protein
MIDLDWNQIPALIGLGKPPINFNNQQRILRIRVFNFLIEKCKQQPNHKDHWKKFALSHAVLNADCHRSTNLTFKDKAERIINEDWSQFRLGKFKGRFTEIMQKQAQSQHQETEQEREKLLQQSKINRLLQMIRKGEVSRGLEQYLSDAKMAERGEETFKTLYEKHPRENTAFNEDNPEHQVPAPTDEQYRSAKLNPITTQQTMRAVQAQPEER